MKGSQMKYVNNYSSLQKLMNRNSIPMQQVILIVTYTYTRVQWSPKVLCHSEVVTRYLCFQQHYNHDLCR
jgi:hypothetical protein